MSFRLDALRSTTYFVSRRGDFNLPARERAIRETPHPQLAPPNLRASAADALRRSQILRTDSIGSTRPLIITEEQKAEIIGNLLSVSDLALSPSQKIEKLITTAADSLSQRLGGLVDIELRYDILDQTRDELPLGILVSKLMADTPEIITEAVERKNLTLRAGPYGENVAVVPFFDAGNNLLGAFRLRSTAEMEDHLGTIRMLGGVINAAIKNIIQISRLEDLAATDGLTGLANRAYFDQYIRTEVAQCRRNGQPLSLLMVDIDRFKAVNDTLGHPCGDEVLRKVAEILGATVRNSDTAARYGGEEFVVVLPETELEGAAALAEKLRDQVEKTPILYKGQTVKVTISIGVSTQYSHPLNSEKDLIKAADDNMYRAKDAGRNRVVS